MFCCRCSTTGGLTDGQGRTVDFKHTLIIMTSNLGSEYLVSLADDEDVDAAREPVMTMVKAAFRPEFLNRVDEIILFHRLRRNEMGAIVAIQIRRLAKLLEDRKISIELDDSAVKWLGERGYDPAYGARPLEAGDAEGTAGPAGGENPWRRDPRRVGHQGVGGVGPAGVPGGDGYEQGGVRFRP